MPIKETSPLKVLEGIIGREIKTVDTSKFGAREKKTWYVYAQELLRNPVLISLIGSEENGQATNGQLYLELVESLVTADSWEKVKDIQMTINGIELIRDAIRSVEKPDLRTRISDEDEI